jgi:hypothetical protein
MAGTYPRTQRGPTYTPAYNQLLRGATVVLCRAKSVYSEHLGISGTMTITPDFDPVGATFVCGWPAKNTNVTVTVISSSISAATYTLPASVNPTETSIGHITVQGTVGGDTATEDFPVVAWNWGLALVRSGNYGVLYTSDKWLFTGEGSQYYPDLPFIDEPDWAFPVTPDMNPTVSLTNELETLCKGFKWNNHESRGLNPGEQICTTGTMEWQFAPSGVYVPT